MRYRDIILARALGKGKKGMAVGWPLMLGVAGGGTETTITGVSPLLLAAALKKPLKSLTQFGLCSQADTPTPSAPVPIMCNNGAVQMVDDELPAAYKRVLGFACNNNAMWQITGFKLRGSDTVRISFSVTAACNVFGCYQGTDATDNYDLYVSTTANSKYLRYGNGTYLSYWSSSNLGVRFDVVYTPTGTTGMPDDSTWTPATFTSANDLLIGSTTTTGTSAKMKGSFYGTIIVDGRLKLIPCERVSDNVLGYYDTYSETFYEPYTGYTGAVSLGYDGSHYERRVVGTDEVIYLYGKNLDGDNLDHIGFTSTGGASTSETFVGTGRILPCNAGEKYTISFGGFTTSGISGIFVNTWKTDGTFNLRQAISSSGTTTYQIPAGVNKVNFTLYKTGGATIDAGAWMQVQYGATASDYVPYVAPQTASAPDLYAVGDYADEVEIISGGAKRKVGVYVFTGEENVSASGAGWSISISDKLKSKVAVLCTHYPYSSATMANAPDKSIISFSSQNIGIKDSAFSSKTDVTDFFTAQYDAGTPVIVVYPLAEETTESVTPQELTTNAGDNTIIVTANVNPIQLDAVYMKGETV